MKKLILAIFSLIVLAACSSNIYETEKISENNTSNNLVDKSKSTTETKLEFKLSSVAQELKDKEIDGIIAFDCANVDIYNEEEFVNKCESVKKRADIDYYTAEEFVNKCESVKKHAEIDYYKRIIAKNTDDEYPMRYDYTKEYQKYKDTIPSYEEYLKNKPLCINGRSWHIDHGHDCKNLTQQEYDETIGKIMDYNDFKKKEQKKIYKDRELFKIRQNEYKKYIEYYYNNLRNDF